MAANKVINPFSLDEDQKPTNIYNAVQNDVFIRASLLEKADDYFNGGKEYESVHHQVEALCIGFRSKFKFSSKSSGCLNDQISQMLKDIRMDLLKDKDKSPKELSAFTPEFPEMKKFGAKSDVQVVEPTANLTTSTKESLENCRNLPKEWTVVQITKQFDPSVCFGTANEILTTSRGIYITLLKYPRFELNDFRPISVFVPNKIDDLYLKNWRISELIKTTMKIKDVKLYGQGLVEIDQNINEILDSMFQWLGPWVALFLGEFKSTSAKTEESIIFTLVDEFFQQEKIKDKRALVLVSLIARGIDLLSSSDLETFAKMLASDNQNLETKLVLFLTDLKTTKTRLSYNESSFPTVLVVDELLDGFYWEMLLPSKEICRCSALHIFMELFKKYKDQIRDGYLQLNVSKGTALINLGDDLPNMQKRITAFFKYWKPSWRKFVKTTPNESEIEEFLKSSDVVVYSGHGSGQQFVNPEHIRRLNVNCAVFLFGCESVKLATSGWCSERTGIHLFYHYILCPLVVGTLTIVTDVATDQICVLTLSTWLKPEDANLKHIQYVDRKKFKAGLIEFSSTKLFKELTEENDPNLLKLFTKIRQISSLSLWMRSAFVLRGLPLWNIN